MASKDNQTSRKRDKLLAPFTSFKSRSRSQSKSKEISPQISDEGLRLNAGIDTIVTHHATICEQAFERFRKTNAAEANLLRWHRDEEFTDPADWQNELLMFMKSQQEEANAKKLRVHFEDGAKRQPLNVSEFIGDAVEWIEKMVQVGDTIVQYDPGHAALPWAAFRFILKSAVNYTKTSQIVWSGIESICRDFAWINIQEQLYLDGSYKAQEALQNACLEFYLAMFSVLAKYVKYYEKTTINRIITSPFVSPEAYQECLKQVSEIKMRVQESSVQIAREDELERNQKVQKVLEALKLFEKSVGSTEQITKKVFEVMEEDQRQRILEWISPIPYANHYSFARGKALRGTGAWLLEREEFQSWRNSEESQVLRIQGGPGTGKSTLLSILIESLQTEQALLHKPGSKPVWFYCVRSAAEPERREHISILRCLLRQLAVSPNQEEVHSAVSQLYRSRNEKGLPQADEIISLCKTLIADRGPTFMLVDALDECGQVERTRLLNSLATLLKESVHTLKICVSCRLGYDESVFNELPEVRVDANKNSQDIRRYISYKVDGMIEGKQILGGSVSSELCKEIVQRLNDGADGMFRWVELQLELIMRAKRERTIRERLANLPPGLTELYMELFDYKTAEMRKDDPDQLDIVLEAFKWLLVANRQLTYYEFCKLIGHVDESDEPGERQNLLHSCFGLVEYDDDLDEFKFCHLSVREFFESPEFLKNHKDFDFEYLHAHAASHCLKFLDLNGMGYCSDAWPFHAEKAASHRQREPLKSQLSEMFLRSDNFRCTYRPEKHYDPWEWAEELPARHSRDSVSPKALMVICEYNLSDFLRQSATSYSPEQLHNVKRKNDLRRYQNLMAAAAQNGSIEVMEILIDLGMDVEPRHTDEESPLASAADSGQNDAICYLLERGANVNAIRGWVYGTALAVAAAAGELDTVKLLLERGAEVNAIAGLRNTALGTAAGGGKQDVVELLIEYGAEVNAIGKSGGTALMQAAQFGRLNTVTFLLERGAEINAIDSYDGTALAMAASFGRLDMVELLLDRGANVDTTGGYVGTPLIAAVYSGKLGIVELLLERGAKVNAMGGKHGTPLAAAAAYSRKLGIVELLLERGAEVNAIGGEYGTALAAAAYSGKLDAIELLLERGAEVNAIGGEYGTALAAAAYEGNLDIVELLLERGAEVSAIGRLGTALAVAAHSGKLDTVELLLKRGAEVNAIGGEYSTALAAAACEGRPDIVKPLLESGADVNAIGGGCGTALVAAAHSGKLDTVELLLKRGAEVNAIGGEYSTALAAAACEGRPDIVKPLLESGADVNAIGGGCGTALVAAARSGKPDAIELLLERGAEVNAKGGRQGTALTTAVYWYKPDVVKLLLERGADVNMTMMLGTALDVLRRRCRVWDKDVRENQGQRILASLLEYGATHSEAYLKGESRTTERAKTEAVFEEHGPFFGDDEGSFTLDILE